MSNVDDFFNKTKDIFTLVVYFNIIRKVKKMKRKEDLRILKTKEPSIKARPRQIGKRTA